MQLVRRASDAAPVVPRTKPSGCFVPRRTSGAPPAFNGRDSMTSTRPARVRRAALTAGTAAALGLVAVATASPVGATQSPSASVAHDTLTVTGTNASELLALRLQTG